MDKFYSNRSGRNKSEQALNYGLLSLSLKTIGTKIVGRHVIGDLGPILELEEISSFYRQYDYSPELGQHLDHLIIGVLKFVTSASIGSIEDHVRNINENNFKFDDKEGFRILAFNESVIMTPELTLPCPTLFSNQVILGCAREVWPDYLHPVFKKTLKEIEYSNPDRQNFNFYMQGSEFLRRG